MRAHGRIAGAKRNARTPKARQCSSAEEWTINQFKEVQRLPWLSERDGWPFAWARDGIGDPRRERERFEEDD